MCVHPPSHVYNMNIKKALFSNFKVQMTNSPTPLPAWLSLDHGSTSPTLVLVEMMAGAGLEIGRPREQFYLHFEIFLFVEKLMSPKLISSNIDVIVIQLKLSFIQNLGGGKHIIKQGNFFIKQKFQNKNTQCW